MSAPPDLAETATASLGDLAALRAELDCLDDALQDLLIERGHAVVRIAELGGKGRVALRPGREAAIIRRLLSRHSGRSRLRSGRIAGVAGRNYRLMQGPYLIAVCDGTPVWLNPDGSGALRALTRRGASPPHRGRFRGVGPARRARPCCRCRPRARPHETLVWTQTCSPTRRGGRRRFMSWDACRFGSRPTAGAPREQGLIVSAIPPTLPGTTALSSGLKRNPIFATGADGLSGRAGAAARGDDRGRDGDAAGLRVLVEIEGFVSETDPRLSALGCARPGMGPRRGRFSSRGGRSAHLVHAGDPRISPDVGGEFQVQGMDPTINALLNEGAFKFCLEPRRLSGCSRAAPLSRRHCDPAVARARDAVPGPIPAASSAAPGPTISLSSSRSLMAARAPNC